MRLLILCFSLLTLVSTRAQHHHFLYLQADQQQPFYVKMGASVLSSSADGFLIIPRLRDSAVQMIVGFPSKKFPEYRFRFSGFRKDRGMALKDFGEKGWGLFDYQTLEIVMGEKIEEPGAVVPPPPVPLTNDLFTVVLASVIDDPGLLATPLVQMRPKEVYVQTSAAPRNPPPSQQTTTQPALTAKKPSRPVSNAIPVAKDSAVTAMIQEKPSAPSAVLKDSAVSAMVPAKPTVAGEVSKDAAVPATLSGKPSDLTVVPKDSAVVIVREKPVVQDIPAKESAVLAATAAPAGPVIRKITDQERPLGRALVFLDHSPGRPDTVDVFIPVAAEAAAPVQKPAEPTIPTPAVAVVSLKPADSLARVVETKPKAPVPEERIKMDEPDTTAGKAPKSSGAVQTPIAQPDTTVAKPGKPIRSNCSRMASEKDLQALRQRMVGIRDEDDMVAAALKDVKQRCYTTEQVKALTVVFVRQEGKYKLIDAVYPHVYDPANYGTLEPLLTDKYFIHRFRALVQQ